MRALPLIALGLAGCGAATYNLPLTPRTLAPTSETAPVRIYSGTQPRCPVEDVALVTSRFRDFASESELEGLRREARRLGGDAVVQVRLLEERVLTGTVVRFTNPDCKE